MTYPGNNSLSSEIRRRVRETFLQTLDLAASGSQREALLGCDFILRLDPLFDPARTLQQRLRSPAGAVDLADLRATLGETDDDAGARAPAKHEIAPALADLGSIELDLSAPADEPGIELDLDADAPTMRVETLRPGPGAQASDVEDPSDESADAPTMRIETGGSSPSSDAQTVKIETAPEATSEPSMRLDALASLEGPGGSATGSPGSNLDTESEMRVKDLLQEGQAAFDSGEPQMAIDAWSRIFLIDIDHPEATRRIDRARSLKAEIERSLEQSLHEAISLAEAGEFDRARELFEKVLEEEPNHVEARDQLQLLEQRERGETTPAPAMPAPNLEAVAEKVPAAPRETEKAEPRRMAPMEATQEQPKSGRLFSVIGGAVLLLVLGGGWFVFTNWSRFFPNSAAGADGGDAPIDPMQQRPAAAAETEFELDDTLAERAEVLSRARGALAAGNAIYAEALFQEAHEMEALEGESAAAYRGLRERLDPVRDQLEVFRQGEWEFALRELWPLHQANPDSQVITDLMIDCYYNMGVRDLQRGDPRSAAEMFAEAADLRPEDRQLERLTRFATTYQERTQDLLYRIFVKYLPFR